MRNPLSQRIIAGILLLNHVLASCSNPNMDIGPSRKASESVIAINRGHKQPEVEAVEDYDLAVVSPEVAVIQVEEETLVRLTQQDLSNLPTTQAIQSRPLNMDNMNSRASKLEIPLASRGNVYTPVQLAPDNKRKAAKQAHQPIILRLPSRTQVPPMIIYPGSPSTDITKDQQQVQGKGKHQCMQQLEPMQLLTEQKQQKLHTSIVQTLQNPIWQQHFSGRQLTATQLLPSTRLQLSSTRGQYQFAHIQERFQPLVPILSLQTREGHRIDFLQDMGYWWGRVQENCPPGFSRSLVLPVLYPQPSYMEQMGHYIQHTVEGLLHAPKEVQRQLVHIFSSNKAFKNAFVYMGREMGLVGGGFWSFVGSCIATVVTSVVVGFGSGFAQGGLIGGIFGAITGCVMGVTACVREYKARQKTRNELESIDQRIQKVCKQALQDAKDEVKQIQQDPKAYKDKQKRAHILKRINDCKDSANSEISKLEQWGKGIKEGNWFLSVCWPGEKELEESKFMWDEDFDYLKQCIQNRKEEVEKINSCIQDAKDQFREQAWADLQADKNLAERAVNTRKQNLASSIMRISATNGLEDANRDLAAIKTQVYANINKYETWKKEESLYARDVAQINGYIQGERNRLVGLETEEQLIEYAGQDDNIVDIQQVAETNLPHEDLQDILANGADQGNYWLLYYAFHYQHKSPNTIVDEEENTVLHRAVLANQTRIVQLCLQYDAGVFIKNRPDNEHPEGRTPWDLAAHKPEIKKILETGK